MASPPSQGWAARLGALPQVHTPKDRERAGPGSQTQPTDATLPLGDPKNTADKPEADAASETPSATGFWARPLGLWRSLAERVPFARRLVHSRLARIALAISVCLLVTFGFVSSELNDPGIPTTVADQVERPSLVLQDPLANAPATTVPSETPEPPPPLDANPFFVSPTIGNDDNDGTTIEAPWASLQVALNRLEPGQTLYLMDGNYSETVSENFHYIAKNGGTEDAWVRLKPAPGHNPVLLATVGTALEVQANYFEVSGLTVRGEGFNEDLSFGVGLSVRRSHHVTFDKNTISGMPLAGISAIESSNLEIIDNTVFENAFWSTAQGSGISIWHSLDWEQPPSADGYHDRVIGNAVYRNENRVKSRWKNFSTITDGNGIIIDQNRDFNYSGRTLVANNLVFDNGGRGILVFESNRVDVLFNTSYHNGWTEGLEGGGVELAAGKANDVRFLNNLAWAQSGIPAIRATDSNDVETAGNVLVTDAPSGTAGDRDLVLAVDPGLVNPSIDETVADFRPEPTSVLVGRALALKPLLPYDIVGATRLPESADVGAYEVDVP